MTMRIGLDGEQAEMSVDVEDDSVLRLAGAVTFMVNC